MFIHVQLYYLKFGWYAGPKWKCLFLKQEVIMIH